MNTKIYSCILKATVFCLLVMIFLFTAISYSKAQIPATLTINVVDGNGNPVSGFRWLLEEDTTHPVTPEAQVSDSLAVSIHKSYAPPVDAGVSDTSNTLVNIDNSKRYMVSVLPFSGYSMGGANVAVGQTSVTVTVNDNGTSAATDPLPTAQISVFVYHDNKAINGLPDIPAEAGLPNFNIQLFDALGQMMTDVFGNMLGTTYVMNPDGSFQMVNGNPVVDVPGSGIITDANGMAIIKNIAPGNYGVAAVPVDGLPWIQTTAVGGGLHLGTIVKAGEPPFFTQAGILNMHVFIGFTLPFNNLPAGTGTITGSVANLHSSRPPSVELSPGTTIDNCYVGINSVEAGTEIGYLAQACDPDGSFTITGVPAGTWQLVVWDRDLLNLQSVRTVTIADGANVDVGAVPTPRWLGTLQGSVFNDANRNGLRDPEETGIKGQAINLRARDGSIIQATSTDGAGNYILGQVPPLKYWTVVEVDFANYDATGATLAVDDGGPLSPLPIFPFTTVNNPQPQPDNGGALFRTELGVVLTEGMIVHADQVNVMNFGKDDYPPGGNGGISGIIEYATTRAEDDPRYAAAEDWEPAVPNVQVNLYLDADADGVIDDQDGINDPANIANPSVTLADADNYPFQWTGDPTAPGYTGLPGAEDIDRNYPGQTGDPGTFHAGDAIQVTISDSFDDSQPAGCVGPQQTVHGQPIQDCAETLQTWNQLRPTVFDGGYAFDSYVPGGFDTGNPEQLLPANTYIVEVNLPSGYKLVKEEDRNVDFGDSFSPAPMLLPPVCVGDLRTVPPYFSILTVNGDGQLPLIDDVDPVDAEVPMAGQQRHLCDKKQITLSGGQNAALDFHIFTDVPKAGRIVGQIMNPFANVANPNDPNFGGLLSPSWMPVSIQDHLGNEIIRVYSDEWGAWNAMVPSTYTVNVPSPSGVSPNVLTVCVNHPGPIPGPGGPVTDPRYNPNFAQPCFNIDAFPGKTSYILTPVGAIAGFTGSEGVLDCEFPDRTPIINQVNGPVTPGGPYVSGTGQVITLTSPGTIQVPNPDFDSTIPEDPINNPSTIMRDYGFGSGGPGSSVTVGGIPLVVAPGDWAADGLTIRATVPAGVTTGELIVTRGDSGLSTVMGVTLNIGGNIVDASSFASIQDAIDVAAPGSIVLVPPGEYFENLIIWKPISLQGFGAFSTIINASRFAENKSAWQILLADLIANDQVSLVEGQRADLNLEDGAGITVFGHADTTPDHPNEYTAAQNTRVDGLTIKGAIQGGGVFINGYAPFTEVSNNRFESNQGSFGGGLRIGWLALVNADQTGYNSSFNNDIKIHHNQFKENGTVLNGGGVSLMKGADNYAITENFICGNYAGANGAGISHLGLSDNGLIEDNKIIFNEAFGEGGALLIGGEFVPAGAAGGTLTEGSGNVTVDSNLMQGNLALDDGGGISIFSATGKDVLGDPANRYSIKLFNNMIVNNVAGFSAGAIALSDTVNIKIINNTIAHNDATSTSAAFNQGQLVTTFPMGAGIVSRANSPLLIEKTGEEFANPLLVNNIIWHNRSFYWDANQTNGLGDIVPNAVSPYWDLQVIGVAGKGMDPRNCILSNTTDPHSGIVYHGSNIESDPQLLNPYLNVLQSAPGANALVNFVTFKPLTLTGPTGYYDYHINDGSAAVNRGSNDVLTGIPELAFDYDNEIRPNPTSDIGADEVPGGASDGQNYPPTISSSPVTSCVEGQQYSYQVEAGDPDPGDILTFSLDSAPVGMAIDSATGLIQWTCGTVGQQYPVTVRVTDSTIPIGQSDTQDFLITPNLGLPNDSPQAGINTYMTTEGVTLVIDAAHGVLANDTDPDNGPVSLMALYVSGPTGGMLTCPAGGNLCADGSFEFTSNNPGIFTFTYKANDGLSDSNEATVTIYVGAAPSGSGVLVQCPANLLPEDQGNPNWYAGQTDDPAVVCRHFAAGDGFVNMADGYLQYIFGFKDVTYVPDAEVMKEGVLGAELVSPTIVVKEGQKLYLTVTNVGMMIRSDLFDPHTVHWHGFPEASSYFDGVPNASVSVNMGHSFTYFYNAFEPGTYLYHCHVEVTEHMQMGMYGNIWIEPGQNGTSIEYPVGSGRFYTKFAYNDGDGSTGYNVEYPIQVHAFDPAFHDASLTIQPLPFADMNDKYAMINGRGYPETVDEAVLMNSFDGNPSQKIHSHITAVQGERILLRITNLSVIDYYTLRTLGIPMKVIAKGARLFRSSTGENLFYDTYSLDIGGGEAFDVILDTAGIEPGTYFLYTTNMNYLSNNTQDLGGMMTEIEIRPPAP